MVGQNQKYLHFITLLNVIVQKCIPSAWLETGESSSCF